MADFTGFYGDTAELLLGLRRNNSKEWFESNGEYYKRCVHEPMELLGNGLFECMKAVDKDFDGAPSVSRAALRPGAPGGSPQYRDNILLKLQSAPEAPAYFFEVAPEGYRYGLGFWPPADIRLKADELEENARRLEKWFRNQTVFKMVAGIYGSEYRGKRFITFARYREFDRLFVQQRLLNIVGAGFASLYPMYRHFMQFTF